MNKVIMGRFNIGDNLTIWGQDFEIDYAEKN